MIGNAIWLKSKSFNEKSVNKFNFLIILSADGSGYEILGDKVDYKLLSSARRSPPTEIIGSQNRQIHVELYKDIFLSERFVEVTLSAQIVLSGLQIDTKASMALQGFEIKYVRRGVQYSGEMTSIKVIPSNHFK